MKNLLLVILGGGLGSGLRYLITIFMQQKQSGNFPTDTLLINIAGSLLIGIIFGYYSKDSVQNESVKLLLATGFCGGFTTFSAFTLENIKLIQSNQTGIAVLYIVTSIILGLLAVLLGLFIGKI